MRFHLRLAPRLLALVGCLHFALSLVDAQTVPPPTPSPARLRFLFLDESPGAYALRINKDQFRQVSGSPYEISAPYAPADAKPLEIYKSTQTVDPATGQIRRVKIASLLPPMDTPSALVVVTPRPITDPAAPPVFEVEVIDCNPSKFPGRSIRILNLGRSPMAAQFGTRRQVTDPGRSEVIPLATDSRHRVFFKIAVQAGQSPPSWQLLQNSVTVVRPTERLIGILVYSPSGMKHMLTPAELAELGPPPPCHFWLTFSETI